LFIDIERIGARQLSEKEIFSWNATGSCTRRYANATGRMRSSLKVGSNDSTNASEPASTLCDTSSRELVGECILKIGQMVRRKASWIRNTCFTMTSPNFHFREAGSRSVKFISGSFYIAN